MFHYAGQAHMGSSAEDDFAIPVTGAENIVAVAQILKNCCV
ncbi:hypothetical protein [Photobacterium sp. TY1-4]|nr:hypothetical protein [Photobacterium sp. TY1-4]